MTREEAIEVLKKSIDNTIEMTIREWEAFDLELAEAINLAIGALQDRSTGTWEEKCIEDAPPFLKHRFYCSNCGEWNTYGMLDFCPNCGADMRTTSKNK